MFFNLRFLVILLPIFICNLYSCFCIREESGENSRIASVAREMVVSIEKKSLEYEICSDFAVRVKYADHDGCLSIIKFCLCAEIARRCHPEIHIPKKDANDSTDTYFLESIPVLLNSKCGKRSKASIDNDTWFNLDLPRLHRLEDLPINSDPAVLSLRRKIERILLQRIVDTISR